MKKIKIALIGSLFLVGGFGFMLPHVNAAGSSLDAYVTPSASSVPVGGTIVFNIHAYFYRCVSQSDPNNVMNFGAPAPTCNPGYSGPTEMPKAGKNIYVSVSGSGNTLSASTLTTDGNGNAQVSLSSTIAESKTLGLVDVQGASPPDITVAVAFTPVAAAPATSPPRTTAPSPPAASTVIAPPAAPISTITIGNVVIKPDDKPTIAANKTLTLKGKTVPNGVVAIYVFSEPKKYSVTADKEGNWSYIISGLPVGDHHVEAEVTDPATGKTSSRTQVLAFSIKEAGKEASKNVMNTVALTSKKPTDSAGTLLLYVSSGIALVAVLTIAYLWFFKRQKFLGFFHRQPRA